MAEINSPLGRREFASGQPMKNFTVSDPTFDDGHEQFDPRQQVQPPPPPPVQRHASAEDAMSLRRQHFERTNQVNAQQDENVKRRIEMLTEIGRAQTTVNVDNHEFVLRSLKGREIRHIVQITSDLAKESRPDTIYDIRVQTLAYSLVSIDGVSIDSLLGSFGLPYEEAIYRRKQLLEDLDEAVLNYIFADYQKLMRDNMERFGIKNEADAKEVAEQLRKSGTGA